MKINLPNKKYCDSSLTFLSWDKAQQIFGRNLKFIAVTVVRKNFRNTYIIQELINNWLPQASKIKCFDAFGIDITQTYWNLIPPTSRSSLSRINEDLRKTAWNFIKR